MTSPTENRLDQFLERFLEDETAAAVLGQAENSKDLLGAKLIGRLFPKPLARIDTASEPTEAEVQATLEDCVSRGKVLLVTLVPDSTVALFRPLETLLRDNSLQLSKPQGWVTVDCHPDFRVLIHSPSGSFPFDELVPLKFRF